MSLLQKKFEKKEDGDRIYYKFFALTPEIEQNIRNDIKKLLERRGKDRGYINVVYTCIKELMINALKGNYKKIFFDAYIIENDLSDIATYDKWLELFRLEIEEHGKENFARVAESRGISVDMILELREKSFYVAVKNPVPISDIEKMRISERLKKGEKAANLQELIENSDDVYKEGAGLGLAMVVVLLKNIGGSVENISIRTNEEGMTVAEIEFPL